MTTALLIGRYQPFHNGHLEVVKMILSECDSVIIGIGSSQYSNTLDNPFSGEERKRMIDESLTGAGIDKEKYEIVLVSDIHDDETWVSHVINGCPDFDIVYTQNPHPRELFEKAGMKVRGQPLYESHIHNGTKIREEIVSGLKWASYVPEGTRKVIIEIDGVQRLKDLKNET